METTHEEKQPAFAAEQEFLDVSLHPLCWFLSCPFLHCGLCPYRTVLHFDATAVTREDVSVCGTNRVHVPYSEVRAIESSHCCCGCWRCVDVHGALGTFLPGMGCRNAPACERTRHALQTRVDAIHNHARYRDRRWEDMDNRTLELTEKMDRLLQHLQLDPPPPLPSSTNTASTMERGDN